MLTFYHAFAHLPRRVLGLQVLSLWLWPVTASAEPQLLPSGVGVSGALSSIRIFGLVIQPRFTLPSSLPVFPRPPHSLSISSSQI